MASNLIIVNLFAWVAVGLWMLQGSSVPVETATGSDVGTQVLDILKIVVPALLAYLASRMQARKEQHAAQGSMEQRTREQLAKQQEGVFEEYRTISLQAREVVAESYREAAEAKAACRLAEVKNDTLEGELAELRRKYDKAVEELEELRERVSRRARGGREDREQGRE